jgi:hypothetical protein
MLEEKREQKHVCITASSAKEKGSGQASDKAPKNRPIFRIYYI